MSEIINCDLEENDFSDFTDTKNEDNRLSVAAAAALAGTNYGMSVDIDGDTTTIYGEYTLGTANTSGVVRFRFYIDPNTITMNNNTAHNIINLWNDTPALIGRAYLRYQSADGYMLAFSVYLDDTSENFIGTYEAIADDAVYMEAVIKRAASAISSDGGGEWWIGGVSISSEYTHDNYDRFDDFEVIQMGATGGIDATTTGNPYYMDQLVVRDDDTEIGAYVPQSSSAPDDRPLGLNHGLNRKVFA